MPRTRRMNLLLPPDALRELLCLRAEEPSNNLLSILGRVVQLPRQISCAHTKTLINLLKSTFYSIFYFFSLHFYKKITYLRMHLFGGLLARQHR